MFSARFSSGEQQQLQLCFTVFAFQVFFCSITGALRRVFKLQMRPLFGSVQLVIKLIKVDVINNLFGCTVELVIGVACKLCDSLLFTCVALCITFCQSKRYYFHFDCKSTQI